MTERSGIDLRGAERPSFATIVLAAGRSERFGGFPKALLRIGPRTAIERVIDIARGVSSGPVVAVVPPGSTTALVAETAGAEVVSSPESAKGRTGSLLAGLTRVRSEEAVLVWPVDHPLVDAMTVHALDEVARRDAMATWIIPTFQRRSGHPVLFTPYARPTVETLRPEHPLRSVLARLGVGVRRVELPDPGVVENLDSPSEYERALSDWSDRGGA